MSPAIGTLETKFRRVYDYTDPYLVKDLGLWRATNCQPSLPDDYYKIYGLPPIVVKNFAEPTPLADLSFNINSLQNVDSTVSNLDAWMSTILTILRAGPSTDLVPPTIDGIPPIFTYGQGNGVVVLFNIERLEYAEVYSTRRIAVTVNPYNRSSYVNVTTEPPLYQQNTTDTVTIDFDLTNLDYA